MLVHFKFKIRTMCNTCGRIVWFVQEVQGCNLDNLWRINKSMHCYNRASDRNASSL